MKRMCRITCARNDSGTQGTGGDTAEQPASDDNMPVQTASFRGDISANENVDLEFYCNPDTEGEYMY